jgi:hypothetical protein
MDREKVSRILQEHRDELARAYGVRSFSYLDRLPVMKPIPPVMSIYLSNLIA